ncbi:BRO-N domain-containing protein [Chitinolyticbacter meiyuanensis]|uniref:BRO-N domain-containing protein n=1 Tax=Chitinolyticbacter meiyuanensis TaxID=682798 RepID=UPI0011E5E56A|nr:BRO family protein [Chitinolyticbacter meiyuanensis]
MNALAFQGTNFEVVAQNGQSWLRAADIARALGYSREDAVSKIYDRNRDEFTDDMSRTVKLTVSGEINGLQHIAVRIFSLRGAHLIAMFARTPMAKAFRRWVLDVLDSLNGRTSTGDRTPLRDAINMLVSKRHLMYPDAYAIVHQRFGVSHIDELTLEQLPQAVEYVHKVALEGEWLPPEGTVVLTTHEVGALQALVSRLEYFLCDERIKEIEKGLYAVQSRHAGFFHDFTAEPRLMLPTLKKVAERSQ